jgi:hypothetical protein
MTNLFDSVYGNSQDQRILDFHIYFLFEWRRSCLEGYENNHATVPALIRKAAVPHSLCV